MEEFKLVRNGTPVRNDASTVSEQSYNEEGQFNLNSDALWGSQPSQEDLQQFIDNIYDHALDLYVNQKYSWEEVRQRLIYEGLNQELSETVVNNLQSQVDEIKQKNAIKALRNGALWFGGGLVFTVITGGQYLFWGAMVYGIILLIKGLCHKNS